MELLDKMAEAACNSAFTKDPDKPANIWSNLNEEGREFWRRAVQASVAVYSNYLELGEDY